MLPVCRWVRGQPFGDSCHVFGSSTHHGCAMQLTETVSAWIVAGLRALEQIAPICKKLFACSDCCLVHCIFDFGFLRVQPLRMIHGINQSRLKHRREIRRRCEIRHSRSHDRALIPRGYAIQRDSSVSVHTPCDEAGA